MCVSEEDPGVSFPVRRPLFYYITDRHQLPVTSFSALLSNMKRAATWGVDFIQLREKDLSDLDLFNLTRDAVQVTRATTCKILVNGRIDIALAGGAHGVHLPSTGIGSADLRPHLPRGFLLGASTHSLREARQAVAGGADYLLLGPVFPTPSKIGLGEPLGLARFRRICAVLSVPVFGLGGIRSEDICSVLGAGAAGVAGISLFQHENHPRSRDNYK
ncbi:MAG: thiamine phosphate synthase [Acidobacteriota bacterium]